MVTLDRAGRASFTLRHSRRARRALRRRHGQVVLRGRATDAGTKVVRRARRCLH